MKSSLQAMKYNLSEISELIRNRRTIFPEQFTGRVVQKDMIQNMLQNALWAPTHGMTQPWRFKVFMGDQVAEFGREQAEMYRKRTPEDNFLQKKYDKLRSRADNTSALIVVCMERQETEKIREIEEYGAVASAVQNLMLTATAYGVGSFWSTGGVTYTQELKDYLKLGEKDMVVGQIYLGYPSVEWPDSHRKPLEYVTEWFE